MSKKLKNYDALAIEALQSPELNDYWKDSFMRVYTHGLRVGKWYTIKDVPELLFCLQGVNKRGNLVGYGFDYGEWNSDGGWCSPEDEIIDARKEDVVKALINEAKRRYNVGDRFTTLNSGKECRVGQLDRFENLSNGFNELWSDSVKDVDQRNALIFNKGRWAEVIKPAVKEGKWYLTDSYSIYFVTNIYGIFVTGYGAEASGRWHNTRDLCYLSNIKREATNKEVVQMLIKEAKKRGFDYGVDFKLIRGKVGEINHCKINPCFELKYREETEPELIWDTSSTLFTIFAGGEWAKPIKDTIEVEGVKYKRV